MDRIAESSVAEPPGRSWPTWLAALWTPRDVSVRVRPVYGVFAAIAVAVLIGWSPFERSLSRPATGDSRDPQLFVQFRLQAPEAMTVRLAGTFTDWQPRYELHESAPGIWTITLPLTPGVHVDGPEQILYPIEAPQ